MPPKASWLSNHWFIIISHGWFLLFLLFTLILSSQFPLILSLPHISSAKKNFHAAEIEDQSESSTLWWHHCFYLDPFVWITWLKRLACQRKIPLFLTCCYIIIYKESMPKNSQQQRVREEWCKTKHGNSYVQHAYTNYSQLTDSFRVVQAKEIPGNQTFFSVLNFKLALALVPCNWTMHAKARWTMKTSESTTNSYKLITRLPPEPWVAGNSPVSSSLNPLDSASNLNLHPSIKEIVQTFTQPWVVLNFFF